MEGFIMPTIAAICCVEGLVVKAAFPYDRLHDFIPMICAITGLVVACGFCGWTPENIAGGLVSGVAATGIWEQATHLFPPVVGSHVGGE